MVYLWPQMTRPATDSQVRQLMPADTQVLLKSPETAVRVSPWQMRFVADLGENDGECLFKEQHVLLADSLPVAALVETICHEGGHLTLPDLCEDAIVRLGENLVAMLFACPRLKITLVDGD
jgi:hypothetical protein